MTKELINRAAERFAEEAHSEYGSKLSKIILFGSCSRGDYDSESNLDIMVLLDIPHNSLKKRNPPNI